LDQRGVQFEHDKNTKRLHEKARMNVINVRMNRIHVRAESRLERI
jgi:hypothetical protein